MRTKTGEGCAVGGSKSQNKAVGKRGGKAKRENGRAEEGAMGKMRALDAEQAPLSKNACALLRKIGKA